MKHIDAPNPTVQKVQEYILKMPSLSTTATKVMQVCNTTMPSPNDLNRVISLDPVLTGKVLQLINSAYYARRNKVTSLTRAIIILGINTIKNIVLSSAIVKCVHAAPASPALNMDLFWSHSIHVGVAAKLIAKEMRIPVVEQEFYFLAGLMHDLGKIPLSNQFPDAYEQILHEVQTKKTTVCEIEEKFLGINHCATGGMIAEKWELGDAINEALTFHHDYRTRRFTRDRHVLVIELADLYANYTEQNPSTDRWNVPQEGFPVGLADLMEETGIAMDTLVDFDATVAIEIDNAKAFLNP